MKSQFIKKSEEVRLTQRMLLKRELFNMILEILYVSLLNQEVSTFYKIVHLGMLVSRRHALVLGREELSIKISEPVM